MVIKLECMKNLFRLKMRTFYKNYTNLFNQESLIKNSQLKYRSNIYIFTTLINFFFQMANLIFDK